VIDRADGRDYTGRRAVVTGCASGIGEQLAILLAARGAHVIGLDRQSSSVPVTEFHHVDLADSEVIAEVVAAIADPVDALFNVAGISGTVDPGLVVGINFVGTRELTEALIPRMRAGAAIVNTSSLAASRYLERRELVGGLLATHDREAAMHWCASHVEEVGTGYAISKDTLVWYTLNRAVELAPLGIRMNAIAPGITDTPIIADTIRSRGDEFLKAIPMPLGRMARPEEQATVLAFLNSDDASYLSGQVLWVDGAYSAGVATDRFANTTGSVGAPPAAADRRQGRGP
jgi:NAD(P)-dependent dehydrogenase (short-subunit alcohol dehydrogenase family)